jgi:electron transfer flavoprotein alpha subunit
MDKILILIHTEPDGSLPKSALEVIGGARTLADASMIVGLVGEDIQGAADSIAGCGAERFLGVSGSDFAQPRYSTDAAAAEAIFTAAEATLILAPGSSRWNRVLSGVAHRIGGKVDTHVTGIAVEDGSPQVSRWYYRQRMEAKIRRPERPWVMVVDPGSLTPWEGESGSASIEAVTVELGGDAKRTEVTGVEAPPADEQTIRPEADLLFVTGAGWTKKQADGQVHADDAENLILGFLQKTQSSLGSSKSLVDLGGEGQAVLSFLSHMNQVGQTGSTPRHPKGLATCCHGEEPHVVGWRFVNERRAVNLDAGCGWAQGKADVLYVADAFEIMTKVNELLG